MLNKFEHSYTFQISFIFILIPLIIKKYEEIIANLVYIA